MATTANDRDIITECAPLLGWRAEDRATGQPRYVCGPCTLDVNFNGDEFAGGRFTRAGQTPAAVPAALTALYLMTMHGRAPADLPAPA